MGARFGVIIGSEFPELTIKNLAERSELTCTPETLCEELLAMLAI